MSTPGCPSSPFVGLTPFREADAPFFRGRDAERDLIVENLRASRLTLLYGTSGVGKSSVLYAGAAHRLRMLARQDAREYGRPDFAVVTFSAWRDDPIKGLLRSINEAVADALQVKSLEAVPESGDLAQAIDAWSERYGIELLIILDQFEEYFQYRPGEEGPGTFAEEFPRAVNDSNLRAKFLISLRDDALSKLDLFKSRVPNLFDNMLRIRHMTAESARKAIVEPIEEYNKRCGFDQEETRYRIEPELVEEIIQQVSAGRETACEAGAAPGIEAPYLQLVLMRLWEKEHENGSRLLRKRTLEELKGIENIVQVYLESALKDLTDKQKEVAFRIFDYLVTASGTKIAYFKSDMVSKTGCEESEITEVLQSLSKKSLVLRSVPSLDRPRDARYEVFHDLLAQAIINWRTQYDADAKAFEAAKAAQEALAASKAEADRKHREQETARENFRLRSALGIFAFLLVVAIAAFMYAWTQYSEAQRQKQLAVSAYVQAALREQEADAAEDNLQIKIDQDNSLRDRIEKIEKETDPEKRAALKKALAIIRGQSWHEIDEKDKGQHDGQDDAGPVPVPEKLWPKGGTIRIGFTGGNRALRQKIAEVAQEWTKYANIKFDFSPSRDPEITIGFDSPGSWSYLGTDAKTVSDGQPAMNFGILKDMEINGEQFRRTVLHEFGHLLGLIHEHQNPNANIPWDTEAVYAYYSGPPSLLPREMIDSQILHKYKGDYREFDRASIMTYIQIPKEVLQEGSNFEPVTVLPTELSEKDKEFIGRLYPRD